MKPLHFLLIIFNLAFINLFAGTQKPEIDSPKKTALASSTEHEKTADTLTVNQLNKTAESHFESAPDSTLYYATQAISIAKQLNFTKGMADGYIQLATVNTFKSDYKAANSNLNTALQLYTQINNQSGISEAYIGLARLQDYYGNYNNAIRLFNRALAIRQAMYDDVGMAECYAIMGITYDNMGGFSKALDCYFKSLQINLKYNYQLDAAGNYRNIGVVMQHLKLYQKALDYFNQALNIWQRLKNQQGISTAYQNIGEVLIAKKDYAHAIGYLNKASVIFKKIDDQEGISLINYDLGLYHYYTQQPDSAIYYMNLSLQSAVKNNITHNKAYAYYGFAIIYNLVKNHKNAYKYALQSQTLANQLGSLNLVADATLQLSLAFAGLKQFENAYLQHQLYVSLTDSLKNNESVQKLISYNLAVDFENNQKKAALQQRQKEVLLEQKITQQTRKNTIYAIIIGIMALLIIVYYNAKRKQIKANKLLEIKNREILQQQADIKLHSDKLDELNALKDRLISVLAHDLRTPLSTLRGLFALMEDKDITQTEFSEMAPRVYNKLQHTSDFLDTLLFWINSQVDDAEDTTKSFCLFNLVNQELIYLEDQFKLKNITPVNTVDPSHIVLADPSCIRIVIHNFLTNAIKFSNQNSIIDISATAVDHEKLDFVVKDYGMGMSNEQLNSLFKSKVISRRGTMNEKGTGMGLIFCKDLIKKYNGDIWAKSILGIGTEFGFTLDADKSGLKQPV